MITDNFAALIAGFTFVFAYINDDYIFCIMAICVIALALVSRYYGNSYDDIILMAVSGALIGCFYTSNKNNICK